MRVQPLSLRLLSVSFGLAFVLSLTTGRWPLTTALLAQQPQTYVQQAGSGLAPSVATFPNLSIASGNVLCSKATVPYAGGQVTSLQNGVNYVYFDCGASLPKSSTSPFTGGQIPLAVVVAQSSSYGTSGLLDVRPWAVSPSGATPPVTDFPRGAETRSEADAPRRVADAAPDPPVTTLYGTNGYLPYFSGSPNVENSVIYQSSSNNYIGIGTTSPSALLSVGSSSQFQVDGSGNVTSPSLLINNAAMTNAGNGQGVSWIVGRHSPVTSDYVAWAQNKVTGSLPTNQTSAGINCQTNLEGEIDSAPTGFVAVGCEAVGNLNSYSLGAGVTLPQLRGLTANIDANACTVNNCIPNNITTGTVIYGQSAVIPSGSGNFTNIFTAFLENQNKGAARNFALGLGGNLLMCNGCYVQGSDGTFLPNTNGSAIYTVNAAGTQYPMITWGGSLQGDTVNLQPLNDSNGWAWWNQAGATKFMSLTSSAFAVTSAAMGVGTTTPQSKLDVNGGVAVGSYAGSNAAPSNGLIVSDNVGIGTASPGSALQVGAGTAVSVNGVVPQINDVQTSGQAALGLYVNDGTNNRRASLFVDNTNSVWGLYNTYHTTGIPFTLTQGASGEVFRITGDGNVGIGTTSPNLQLQVNKAMGAGVYPVPVTSGTAYFDASQGNTQELSQTTNATVNNTLSGVVKGEVVNFIICPNGYTLTGWPPTTPTFKNFMSITTSKCNVQSFVYDGTYMIALTSGMTY